MQEQAVLATFCLLLKLKPEIFEIKGFKNERN